MLHLSLPGVVALCLLQTAAVSWPEPVGREPILAPPPVLAPQLPALQLISSRSPAPSSWAISPAKKDPEFPTLFANAFGSPKDYRWEGVLIGGLLLGVGGAVVGWGACSELGGDGCLYPTVGLGLVGGLIGAVVGGFVGGSIPKRSKREGRAPGSAKLFSFTGGQANEIDSGVVDYRHFSRGGSHRR